MIAVGAALSFSAVAGEGVYINSDAWNFWLSEKLASMSRDELKAEIEKDVTFDAEGRMLLRGADHSGQVRPRAVTFNKVGPR